MSFDTSLTRAAFLRASLGTVALGWIGSAADAVQSPSTAAHPTLDDLKAIENMLGLEFSDAERAAALADVKDNLKNVRDLRIAVETPPATVFQPIVPEAKPLRTIRRKLPKVQLPSNDEGIASLTVLELASLLRSKQLSSLELTEAYLRRIKQWNPKLNCIVTLNEEAALAQAKKATEEHASGKFRSLLHGLPYGLKDLFATKDLPTTWGAEPYRDQHFDYDCRVVQLLNQAGAILLAKTTLGALAMDDKWFGGQTKNPWNLAQGSSGSSAGSASGMGAGLFAFAVGTETLGSIVSPSHRCRVTGLRPTFGRISRSGAMALSWTMDKAGPICRCSDDTLIVLQALQGADPKDPASFSAPIGLPSGFSIKNLRIGILGNGEPLDEDDQSADQWQKAVRALGAKLVPIKVEMPHPSTLIGLSVEAAAAFEAITRDGKVNQLTYSAWPQIFRAHRYFTAVEYIETLRVRRELMEKFEAQMQNVDVIASSDRGGQLLFVTNLTGHPQLYLPMEDGKGISLIGHLRQEAVLCAVGQAIQDQSKLYRNLPKLS